MECSPGKSLWSLIAEYAPEPELPMIRATLGDSLVQMYIMGHTEAETWQKIWQQSQHSGNHGGVERTSTPRQRGFPLADPPAVKELVRAEVKMLLQNLKERASSEKRDYEKILSQYKCEVVNYALSYKESIYNNSANTGDTDNGSGPSSDRSSVEEIEALKGQINIWEINQVADRLRSLLERDYKALIKLIDHLKKKILGEMGYQVESVISEPSLGELKELRAALEKELEHYPPPFVAPRVKDLKNRPRTFLP